MLAVEAPVRKLAVIAAAALGIGAFAHHSSATTNVRASYRHTLTLVAPFQDHAIYLSAFATNRIASSSCDETPIEITTTTEELPPLTFHTRAHAFDGCEWEATEHLMPRTPHEYVYSYSEQVLSCAPGAEPTKKTPRTGIVRVD